MKKNPDHLSDAARLRRRAEEQLKRRSPENGAERTELEAARLVHELQVHQIELEMQNEELQQTRTSVEALLTRYAHLYDFAPAGYLTFDRKGVIRQANLTGARMLGIERSRLVNRRFGLLVAEGDRRAFSAFLERTFAGEDRESCEVALLVPDASPLYVRIEAMLTEGRGECRAAVLDVSDRHRAEAERERLIQELQAALARVKVLSGLLPMCSNCKRIRNDQGYWKQLESYIQSHSEATFTHSFCPECLQMLYPEVVSTVPTPTASGAPEVTAPPGQAADRAKETEP